jgi:hypothetical protein
MHRGGGGAALVVAFLPTAFGAVGCGGDDSQGASQDAAVDAQGDGPGTDASMKLDAGNDGANTTDADAAGDGSTAPVYPLHASSNGRYLVDQNGRPFLIAGDAPQALIVNLSVSDAEAYFKDRQAHAFNSVWINLLCDTYTAGRSDGSTYDGILPFASGTDFSMPNDKYFLRADAMLKLAAKYGLNVFLDPIETGGWLNAMLANGVAKSRAFGQYLGARYASFDNIVWMSGNDFQGWRDPNNDAVASAVALGIKDMDTRHIHTVELDYNVSTSLDDPTWAPIVSLNAAYTYYPTYAEVLKGYDRTPAVPVFLVEAVYEFESNAQAHQSTPATLRREQYWTNLSGAAGQLYGNHYTWTFVSGWQGYLDSPGAAEMPHLKALFEPRNWFDLVPDENHTVVTAGYGTFTNMGYVDDSDYATAARTSDGSLVLAYMPTQRALTVDMTKLRGMTTARWYDPSKGTYAAIAGSPFPNTGSQTFTPPGANADGDGDWVLVLEAP